MSEEKSIEDRVKDIIVEHLNAKHEQLTPEAKFIEDLGGEIIVMDAAAKRFAAEVRG